MNGWNWKKPLSSVKTRMTLSKPSEINRRGPQRPMVEVYTPHPATESSIKWGTRFHNTVSQHLCPDKLENDHSESLDSRTRCFSAWLLDWSFLVQIGKNRRHLQTYQGSRPVLDQSCLQGPSEARSPFHASGWSGRQSECKSDVWFLGQAARSLFAGLHTQNHIQVILGHPCDFTNSIYFSSQWSRWILPVANLPRHKKGHDSCSTDQQNATLADHHLQSKKFRDMKRLSRRLSDLCDLLEKSQLKEQTS